MHYIKYKALEREKQVKETKMKSRDMLDSVKRKILRSPLRDGHSNASPSIYDEDMIDEETPLSLSEFSYNTVQSSGLYWQEEIPIEDIAATIIQAAFRAHLARRAFRALRSLVKLQALVRGVCVRKQVRIALQCMHALARLQIRVRTRQILSKCSDD